MSTTELDPIKRATAELGPLTADEISLIGQVVADVARPIAPPAGGGAPSGFVVVRAAVVRWVLLDDHLIEPTRQSLIRLEGVIVTGKLLLNEARIRLPVRFEYCEMPDGIDAYGMRVPRLTIWGGQYGPINATRAKIDGEFGFTRGAVLNGLMDLRGASLDALIIKNGLLDGQPAKGEPVARKTVIDARNLDTKFLQIVETVAYGCLQFNGAKINGELQIVSCSMLTPGGTCLSMDGAKVDGKMELTPDVVTMGVLSIRDANVAVGLDAGRLSAGGDVLLSGTRFGGALRLIGATIDGTLDLERATATVLDDDEPSWPAQGKLKLAGFTYDALGTDTPSSDVARRLEWLKRRGAVFKPQPYDQLASVLRKMGREADARTIVVARQRAKRSGGETMSFFARCLNVILDWTVLYGYSGFRPATFVVALFLIGGLVYRGAERDDLIVHRPPYHTADGKPGADDVAGAGIHPIFSPWVYSFETLIPKPDLFVAHDWTLSDDRRAWPYWLYRWFHTIAGSIALILLALSPTRWLGRDAA